MKIVLMICRILVGSVFIISGLVKANDPLGFSYKLEEYFLRDALDWTVFEPWALTLAVLVCIGEIVLGIALLVGGKMRLTAWSLLLMTLFFGWLTFYTKECDPHSKWVDEYVTDVGQGYGPDAAAKVMNVHYETIDSLYNANGLDYNDTMAVLNALYAMPHQTVDVNEGEMQFTGLVAEGFVIRGIDGRELDIAEIRSPECVLDCGCFGDALKGSVGRSLTPTESFWKDMILLFLILPIFIFQGRIKLNDKKDDMIILSAAMVMEAFLGGYVFGWWFPVIFTGICFGVYLLLKKVLADKSWKEWAIAGAITLIAGIFAWYTYNHLPIKDYRPYKVGANLAEDMKTCSERGLTCPVDVNIYTMKNKQTGEVFEINSADYMQREELWNGDVFSIEDSRGPVRIQEGYESPVKDFSMTNSDYVDIVPDLMADPGYALIFTSKDLEAFGEFKKVEIDGYPQETFAPSSDAKALFAKINGLAEQAQAKGVKVYFWTPASWERIEVFRHEMQTAFDFVTGDEITIKTTVRANPGLMLFQQGVVKGKWHGNDLPDFSELEAAYLR